jgi:hypothetical protein
MCASGVSAAGSSSVPTPDEAKLRNAAVGARRTLDDGPGKGIKANVNGRDTPRAPGGPVYPFLTMA